MRNRSFHLVVLAASALLFADAQPQEQPEATYTVSDNVDLVVLDVAVKNPHDGYVSGLSKDNFKVFEDGRQRQITQFASVDTPITIGLVVDNSGSMLRKRPQVVLAGLAFAKQSNRKDDFFIVNFNNSVVRGLPENILFTDNLQMLRSALYYGQPMGQTALYDAIAYSLRHLELSHQERRALVVVSDGGDNVSETRLPELLHLIQASRATIYSVGLFDPLARDLNPGVLRRFASVSGGEYFQPEPNQVVGAFNGISKDLRNRYTLAYVPDEVNDKRAIRTVKVAAEQNGRRLFVRTRTTYTIAPFSQLVAQQSAKQKQQRVR